MGTLGVEVLDVSRATRDDGAAGWRVSILFFRRWVYVGSRMDDSDRWFCDVFHDLKTGVTFWSHDFGRGRDWFEPETEEVFRDAVRNASR